MSHPFTDTDADEHVDTDACAHHVNLAERVCHWCFVLSLMTWLATSASEDFFQRFWHDGTLCSTA